MTSAGDIPVTVADLRPIDLFDELDDDQLAEWAAVATWRAASVGEIVIDAGQEPNGLICLLEGVLQMFSRDGERFEPTGHQHAPTWIGAVSTLTDTQVGARMVAESPVRMAVVGAEDFRRLAMAHQGVHLRVLHQVRPLMERLTALQQSRERLAALGTMAAGLAHELGNPVSAARRSADQLAEALNVIGSSLRAFVEAGIERADAAAIADLREQALHQCAAGDALSALDAADAQDAMRDRLEEMGVPNAWQLAEPLALARVDEDWLARVQAAAGTATPAALGSIASSLNAQRLVSDLRESTNRMYDLVGTIKAYAYMDRGELVKADVHEGLETTLKLLAHKLKHTQIEVKRDYDRSLPQMTIYGSELNQVWTNLLANAIDALGERGTITVRTSLDGECVLVDIADTGPGIPPDVQDRVFEPFFTTKDVGQGTGLGLETARRIVRDRHGGSLTFDSSERGTTFHVWIPLQPATENRTP
jgi:signal transduction histidine kinase